MSPTFDVVVVGGGIHGVGVAQAVAAAGYSICLLEEHEIASGTSSKSSKLIHGGLRYLESAQFSLVRECLQERQYLLNNAPHLVELKPFLIPIYQQTQRRPMTIRVGLSLYAMLSGFRSSGRFRTLPDKSWTELDGLTTRGLQSVFQYWDAQTDDELLTRAVLSSALDLGCQLIKPAKFVAAALIKNSWMIRYEENGVSQEMSAKVLVNAAGAWANQVLKGVTPKLPLKSVDLIRGTHIVLEGNTSKGIYYLESPIDQRAIFVMPWYSDTLIGTTEKKYQGDPKDVRATREEIEYLLASVKPYFPKFESSHVDNIKHKFAGLRVLPVADGEAFSRPRETIIIENKLIAPGLFTIYGGKLTAYRATSELVLTRLEYLLSSVRRKRIADTRYLRLPQ